MDFSKSTEFGGKLRNSEAIRTLLERTSKASSSPEVFQNSDIQQVYYSAKNVVSNETLVMGKTTEAKKSTGGDRI